MRFKAYIETVEQENLIHQIVNQLHYGKGYDMAMLAQLPLGQLIHDIEELIAGGNIQPPMALGKPVSTDPTNRDAPNARMAPQQLDPHRLAAMVKSQAGHYATQ